MINLKWKIIIVSCLIGILVVTGLIGYSYYQKKQTEIANYELDKQKQKQELNNAIQSLKDKEQEISELQNSLMEWKTRPPMEITKIRWKDVPNDCQDCFRNHILHKTFKDSKNNLEVDVPDVLMGQTANVKIDLVKLCKPIIDVKDIPEEPKPSWINKGELVLLQVAYTNTRTIESRIESWPLELGRGWMRVSIGGYGQMSLEPSGAALGHVAGGIKVELR